MFTFGKYFLCPILLCLLSCRSLLMAAELEPITNNPFTAPALTQTNILNTDVSAAILPVDSAFALTALIEANTNIVLMWNMPPGYYLYKKSLVVETSANTQPLTLTLSVGVTLSDEFFGDVEVYFDKLLLSLPLSQFDPTENGTIDLLVTYQGCAEKLYCYPLMQKNVSLMLPN